MIRKDAFPSNYISSDDVKAGDITATISHVIKEEVKSDRGSTKENVVHFRGEDPKPLILNGTNWDTIEKLSGQADSDNWGGVRITMFYDPTVKFGKETTGGVRIRETAAPAPAAKPAAPQYAPTGAEADAFAAFKKERNLTGAQITAALGNVPMLEWLAARKGRNVDYMIKVITAHLDGDFPPQEPDLAPADVLPE